MEIHGDKGINVQIAFKMFDTPKGFRELVRLYGASL